MQKKLLAKAAAKEEAQVKIDNGQYVNADENGLEKPCRKEGNPRGKGSRSKTPPRPVIRLVGGIFVRFHAPTLPGSAIFTTAESAPFPAEIFTAISSRLFSSYKVGVFYSKIYYLELFLV